MKLSDEKLLFETKRVAKEEQLKTVQLLEFLAEIEKRMLYIKLGYTSLFTYLVQELNYGESEAALRVKAMRLTLKTPEVKDKMASGKLSLSNAASVESFAREQKIEQRQELSSLIEECEGKSTRELKRFLEEKKQQPILEFHIKLKGSAAEKMQRLKKLMPELSDSEIIEALLEEKLTALKLEEKKERTQIEKKIGQSPLTQLSVHISIRRQLHSRAKGQCEHVDKKTGKRCPMRIHLQIEHCHPQAWGGDHSLVNLMILCRSHNLARATQSFGVTKMAKERGLIRAVPIPDLLRAGTYK